MKISEDFDKTIIYNINGFIVMVDVPEDCFKAISIKLLIEDLLISMVIANTVKNNLL